MKLDFGIDRKSANFYFKNPQNISVDQIITELSTFSFHYELVMNFPWNPKESDIIHIYSFAEPDTGPSMDSLSMVLLIYTYISIQIRSNHPSPPNSMVSGKHRDEYD